MNQLLLLLRGVLALVLYAFLGVALYVMWHGLRRNVSAPVPRPPTATLVFEGAEGRRVYLRPVTDIGRAPDNHVILDDPFVSTHHAVVVWREGRWWLEDLESHNGTLLNQERIPQPMPLTHGDRISIGQTTLRFECIEDAG